MLLRSVIIDRVLHLVFADPKTRNSLSLRAAEELQNSLTTHTGQYDAVCFRAEGRVFCSGGNLSDYRQMVEGEEGRVVNQRIATILDELARLPVATFCLVEGDCFGGGVELLSAFDFVYSAPHSFFGLWQRRAGLTFGWGGGARLAKRLGEAQLKNLAMASDTISAQHAREIGLIDAVALDPLAHFQDVWKRMANRPRAPIAGFKRWTPNTESQLFGEYWWSEGHLIQLHSRRKG